MNVVLELKLKGLKILGKVDQDKIKPKEKKKDVRDKSKPVQRAGVKTGSTDDDASKKRRKRRRKKVNIEQIGKQTTKKFAKKTDEVKEVSQKEIVIQASQRQKYIDQGISVNTSYNPEHFEDEKVPVSVLIKDILTFYKYKKGTVFIW